MKLKRRVLIGLLAGAMLAFLLNTFVVRSQELMDERLFIAESGYRYMGETVVSEEVYAGILSYIEHFKSLGDVSRLERHNGGMVLIRYNFLSREYYPELTQVGMASSLQIAQSVDLVVKVTIWFIAPGLLFLVIILWPQIAKEEVKSDVRR